MNFKLTTSGYFYDDKSKERLEKLGFNFIPTTSSSFDRWTIDRENEPFLVFESIEVLKDWWLMMKIECSLIINFDRCDGPEIEIYDDYRE